MSRNLSDETRELLILARGDAPPPRARDAIWNGLERAILPATAVGIGAAAAASPVTSAASTATAAAPHAAAAAVATPGAAFAPVAPVAQTISATWLSAGAAKVAATIAFVGTAAGLSMGVVALRQPAPTLMEDTRPAVVYADEGVVSLAPRSFPAVIEGVAAPASPAVAREKPSAPVVARASLTNEVASDDTLLREASLVGEARTALLRGDPQTALVSVQAARREGKNLEPEELSIEARALRALGRETEASQLDAMLRLRYPKNALIR